MLAAHQPTLQMPHRQLTPVALLQGVTTPAVILLMLMICTLMFGTPFNGPYLILALIVFSLTFPGRLSPGPGIAAVVGDVMANWFAVAALMLLLGWSTRTLGVFDQRVILAWILATPVALATVHFLIPIALPRLMAAQGVRRGAVIAGGGELAQRLKDRIGHSPYLGIQLAGYFDDRSPDRLNGVANGESLGGFSQLAAYVKQHHVDLIYITLPMTSQPRILKLLDELRDTTASVYFVPDIFVADLIQARMDTVEGMPIVAVCETPFYGVNGLVKRASDVVLASLILVLIAPLMLAIAIGIWRTSPGPILFKQRRYGLDGREITVYKFRSMNVLEDGAEVRQATRNDSRITPFGSFLRRSSLDELPQFINVLQGRMSIVGPRPHAVAHNELYRKLINGYMIRHKVRPGITGWAQVNGLRGETESLEKMQARIEHDLAYLRNWSLQLDLKIIFKTLSVVLERQNAY